jgi:4-diphosphocytidyl-2-C-methyl-D-erythritol kinase
MPEARVAAQAKVNLRLKILAREADGYHSIETIFARIDLADEIVVRAGGSGRSIDCHGADDLGPAERNLGYRAALAYSETTGWPDAFAIEITKKIPVGGGLGGGSADAGAVLRALDAMSPHPLGPRLITLAAELGSDVPFLTIDSPFALGWSRGERLMPLPTLAWHPVVIVTPAKGIATADAYGWAAESRAGFTPTSFIIDSVAVRDWTRMAAIATNDFDSVVFPRFPDLGRAALTMRQHGALISMLAGSGSSVIGVFDALPAAEKALAATGMKGLITRTATSIAPVEVSSRA